ncbi:MAG TPA: glucose-6-phosphate dehydrogenase [Acidimicrobiales bacterium]|nr:glucose-6-phosphate dehydrogenase [Acidimicrobiales bacterium]
MATAEPVNPLAEYANPLAEGLDAVRRAPPGVLVVFGASGDLTHRKLLPALESLSRRRLLPPAFAIIGVARTEMSDDAFRDLMAEAVPSAGPGWAEIIKNSSYMTGEYSHPDTFAMLQDRLRQVDESLGTASNRVYYLATVPDMFAGVARALGQAGLNHPADSDGSVRLVIEKPFGHDRATARELDKALHEVFDESQIYRIDHYLGKETVQNVLALRFANAIFEPLWTRNYLDHVQITVAESLGVEKRGSFYEKAGALRDIVQNHVMQVLSLTLMEPPGTIDSEGIRDEKVKALRSVVIPGSGKLANVAVRAQYDSGWVEGVAVPGYRQEPGVSPNSQTETYVALKLGVDNWRWAGVPIYIRTGKRLQKRLTEVALQFKAVPHLAFPKAASEGLNPNALVMRIQPDEGVTLRFGAKVPGQAFRVRDVLMDFSYGTAFLEEPPEAYERLLLDAMVGEPTLFIRSDEVDTAWQIVEPLIDAWAEGSAPLAGYAAGSWGPRQADTLIQRDGRQWRTP